MRNGENMIMEQQIQEPSDPPDNSPDGNRPAYSEDGVDLTLIRWMLSLTPRERLEAMQQSVQSIMRMRDANPDL